MVRAGRHRQQIVEIQERRGRWQRLLFGEEHADAPDESEAARVDLEGLDGLLLSGGSDLNPGYTMARARYPNAISFLRPGIGEFTPSKAASPVLLLALLHELPGIAVLRSS
jgi:hypothetical protein